MLAKPRPEIFTIEDACPRSKIVNVPQHGKQVRVRLGIKVGNSGLMVSLQ